LITPKDQQALWGRITLFTGRHKPIRGGLTAAVLAADTREKSDPAPLKFDAGFQGNKVSRYLIDRYY
ncbi:MAG: hypothetical protein V2I36_09830, partial [Desulfopila sp.]|nr:hypothetical protein [Desulfopila sp.]